MKIQELREKTAKSLLNMLENDKEKLRKLRFDLAAGKVKNVRSIRAVRKDIAKIKTVIKEKNA